MTQGNAACPSVILGSGFSRALSEFMPTMWELGAQVLDELNLPDKQLQPFNDNLEQWMSYLAADQPWLTPAQNYENRALFARVSDAVQVCIHGAEESVINEAPLPDWLLRLVWKWCDERTHIFSFNYDTLVERAVMQLNRIDTFGDLYALPLEWRVAAGDGGRFGGDAPRDSVLSLYKLHGSTNWSFGGLDSPPNSRILLTGDFLQWAPTLAQEELSPRERSMYDDVVPLIIPPTLTKGPYYSNLSLRGQWRRAAEGLRESKDLTVMGYSFPSADLVALQWVSTSFAGGKLGVVDSEHDRPAEIRKRLPDYDHALDSTGQHAIERYVDRECGDLVRWRLWLDGTEAQISLSVNGRDLTKELPASSRPWDVDYSRAQLWLHKLIERAEPGVIDRAIGSLDGSSEDRWVVLQPGNRLTI